MRSLEVRFSIRSHRERFFAFGIAGTAKEFPFCAIELGQGLLQSGHFEFGDSDPRSGVAVIVRQSGLAGRIAGTAPEPRLVFHALPP